MYKQFDIISKCSFSHAYIFIHGKCLSNFNGFSKFLTGNKSVRNTKKETYCCFFFRESK